MSIEKHHSHLDERVAGLESHADHVSAQLDAQSRDIKTLANNMQMGFDRIASRDRTQWSPIIAGAMAVLVVVGMYGNSVSKDTDRLESASLRILDSIQAHAQSEGHAGVRLRLDDLRRDTTGFSERNSDQIQSLEEAFLDVIRALRAKDAEIASDVAINQTKIKHLEEKNVHEAGPR